MHDRRRRRGAGGEDLPLFRDGEAVAESEGAADSAAPAALTRADTVTRPVTVERIRGVAAGRFESIEAGGEDDEADLPLRPTPEIATPSPTVADLRIAPPAEAAPASAPRMERTPEPDAMAPAPAPREAVRPRPMERTARAEEWSLGAEAAAPPKAVERPAYAGERAQAAMLDLALLGTMWALVVYFASRAAHVELLGLRPAWPYLAAYLGFLGLTYAAYFTGTTGQTLGKIALGLRVVDAGGRPPGYVRAFLRAALGSAGVLLAGAALVPVFLDPARRALHDRLARTRVVKG
jgi:uncharacterized RDD family membrane protein YckC